MTFFLRVGNAHFRTK